MKKPIPAHTRTEVRDSAAHSHDHQHHEHPEPEAHPQAHFHQHSHDNPDAVCCAKETVRADAPLESQSKINSQQGSIEQGMLLYVPTMDCTVEENQIRQTLEGFPKLERLRFDLSARTIHIEAPESAWVEIQAELERSGFSSQVIESAASPRDIKKRQRKELMRHVLALLVAIAAELIHLLLPDQVEWQVTGMVVAAVAIGLAGFEVLGKGLSAIRHARLNINALMTVAVIGAFVIGDWPEAAMVMALYGIAELIEAAAVTRARSAISGLLDLAPTYAHVRQVDMSWLKQAVHDVPVGAVVRVRPGERFAFDALVREGVSSADQSAITGESAAVEKVAGDSVYAGTVNQYGELIIEVTTAATDTVLAQIIEAVEQAQSTRAPIQRFVDQFAAVYTPAVFVLAVLIVVTGPWLFEMSWIDSLYKGLVMLVIACPCALVISTPVTLVSGLTAATRMGILVKGGVFIEQARRLKALAVDKTGTLTQGRPSLVSVATWRVSPQSQSISAFDVAKALSGRSDHPVSMAIHQGLLAGQESHSDRDDQRRGFEVASLTAVPGKGVEATVQGGLYRLGNHRWIHELGLCSPSLEDKLQTYEDQGQTVSLLCDENDVLLIFAVADTLRSTTHDAVSELKAMGVAVVMMTGDNSRTAHALAARVGIEDVRAELLPQEKQQQMATLVSMYGSPVGMVGDGINDAPALTQADIGIAMGQSGTDIAMNAADVVIMNDDLRRIPRLIRLSQHIHHILWQNISLALGIKLIFLVLAAMDQATMWMAVFADMGASLLVVANGLRVLGRYPKSSDNL